MSGEQNDKETRSNSSPPHQQEENFMRDNAEASNATTSGTDGNTTTTATEAGNTTSNATEAGNATTDGTNKGKNRKQIRQRRLNELSNITEDVYEVSLANGEPTNPDEVAANYGGQCGCILQIGRAHV